MNSISINEIAYNILNTLRGGRSTHSEHLSLEQIKFTVNYYRSMFIRRDLERNYDRYRLFEQDLGIVEASLVDSAEDSVISSGNIIIRTDNKIPTPIRAKRWETITHVSCPDKIAEPYPVVDIQKIIWQKYNKFTNESPQAFFRDVFVYVVNDVSAVNLNIRGVFEDPEEVFNFINENGTEFYDEDAPYPLPEDMIEGISKGIIKGELGLLTQSANDTELDQLQNERSE